MIITQDMVGKTVEEAFPVIREVIIGTGKDIFKLEEEYAIRKASEMVAAEGPPTCVTCLKAYNAKLLEGKI
jgi:hypothetical protein